MRGKRKRDVEKTYPKQQMLAKLRRLIDSVEQDRGFAIQVHGERIRVPAGAVLSIEHERGKDEEEIEIQLKWKRADRAAVKTPPGPGTGTRGHR